MDSTSEASLAGEVTSWKAGALGLLLAALGFVAAGLSTKISTLWLQSTALALATTLISTGVLALLFELALRRSVSREMLRLVGVSRALSAQQITDGGRSGSLSWPDLFRSKSKLSFLLMDPAGWVDQHIAALLEGGRQRPISIEFFVPDPKADYIDTMSASLATEPTAFRHSVTTAVDRIERTWKALGASKQITHGSRLVIRFLQIRPLYSLSVCDDVTAVILTGVIGRDDADTDYFYMHVGDRESFPSSWFRAQLTRLGSLPIRFEDRI